MNKKIHLKEGETALYIGSGTGKNNIKHIQEKTDAETFILSDFDYKNKNTEQQDGYEVITTNKDGYEILKKKDNIGFVMIDQAATDGFKNAYTNIKTGTYLYMHTSHNTIWNHPLYKKRMGLKKIDGLLFKKTKKVTAEDVTIADDIIQIDTELNFLRTIPNNKPTMITEMSLEGLRSIIPDIETKDFNNESYILSDEGEIISKESLSQSLDQLTEKVKYIATKIDKNEKAYLNKQLLVAQKNISTLDKTFYEETENRLKSLIKDFNIKK